VNVRYKRDFRGDVAALGRVLVSGSEGKRQIPLADLATLRPATGPAMIRNEDGLLTGYVYVTSPGATRAATWRRRGSLLHANVQLPVGYALSWSGQFEAMQRVKERLSVVVPLTLLLVFLLLYLNTRSVAKTMIVLLAVPFSAVERSSSSGCSATT